VLAALVMIGLFNVILSGPSTASHARNIPEYVRRVWSARMGTSGASNESSADSVGKESSEESSEELKGVYVM